MGVASEIRRPKPFLFPEYCKGCGRCITACQKHSITFTDRINPKTGLVPVEIDLDTCNGCGLCFEACPEPYGLLPRPGSDAGAVHVVDRRHLADRLEKHTVQPWQEQGHQLGAFR